MRRYPYKKYLLLLGALFVLLSLPPLFTESIRGKVCAFFVPIMKLSTTRAQDVRSEQLEVENYLLRVEIGKLRALVQHHEELNPLHSEAVYAHVIYRDPGSWSSSLWINVGEKTSPLIQKNSPVILGRSLVGLIDYVGKKQSRVRLITDGSLKPAVRVLRGVPQNEALIEHIQPILRHLSVRADLPLSKEERVALGCSLTQFKELLSDGGEKWHLAKGILQGAGTPLWRSTNHTLRGIGFNYDFPDAKGPARELFSGKPLDGSSDLPTMPLIQLNDLLITTGLDGIFPEGLSVAEVTKIFPLREGAYTYEIEAVPSVGDLNSLKTLFVIPPVGYSSLIPINTNSTTIR